MNRIFSLSLSPSALLHLNAPSTSVPSCLSAGDAWVAGSHSVRAALWPSSLPACKRDSKPQVSSSELWNWNFHHFVALNALRPALASLAFALIRSQNSSALMGSLFSPQWGDEVSVEPSVPWAWCLVSTVLIMDKQLIRIMCQDWEIPLLF